MRAAASGLYFVAWTAAGLFFFSQDMSRKLYFGDPTPWWHYFVTWLIGVWIFAALDGLGHPARFRYYRRYQERETQLARAQLHALKGQLQPHFLFNTLNAIMVLVRQQRGRHAEETLARLSDLLRCVLDDVDSQEVPLRREL